jgi:hypothetical protein
MSRTQHEGINGTVEYKFCAAAGPGNEAWSKWTPNGALSMCVTTESGTAFFEPGKHYFLDIAPASEAP